MATACLLLTSTAGTEAMKVEFLGSGLLHHVLGWMSDVNASDQILEFSVDLISELIHNFRPWYTLILESAAFLKALLARWRMPTTILRVRNKIAGVFWTLVQVAPVDDAEIGTGNFLGPLNDLVKDLLAAGAELLADLTSHEDAGYHVYAVDLIHELVKSEHALVRDLLDVGGVPILLDAFYDAPDDDRVKILMVIEIAAEKPSLRDRLINLDAYKVCATALTRHGKISEIACRACYILRDLTKNPRNRHVELLREAQIPKIIIDFLDDGPGYVARSDAMWVLRNLCNLVHAGLNKSLLVHGALPLLNKTLRDGNCVDCHLLAQEALDDLMALPHGTNKRPNTRARKREREV